MDVNSQAKTTAIDTDCGGSSYSWEGKGRCGSFRLRMNVWVCR